MEGASMLFGGLILQLLGQDYSKQDAQDEVFRLKVRRMKRDRRRGSVYNPHVKVREKLVRRILQEMFHEPFSSARPAWCRNPKSKRLLEIDCYSEKLKLCVEVDGIHHSVYRGHWHKSWEDFQQSLWRDRLKDRLAKYYGYHMLRVPPSTMLPDANVEVYLMTQLAKILP